MIIVILVETKEGITMNINETLKDVVLTKYSSKYNLDTLRIEEFLCEKKLDNRRKIAADLILQMITPHGKANLIRNVSELSQVEKGLSVLAPWARDHVSHALLTYLLGIYIYEEFVSLKYKKNITPFQWQLAAFLHDIGYPLEVPSIITKNYIENQIKLDTSYKSKLPNVSISFVPNNFEYLNKKKNGLELIQKQLKRWDLDIDVVSAYSGNPIKICHGMMSAVTVLRAIDIMYTHYNPTRKSETIERDGGDWNQKYFKNEVIPACTSIFIHNLDKIYFEQKKITPQKATLAYLLRLSDILQTWDRPKFSNHKSFSASSFDICVKDNALEFKAKLSVDDTEAIRIAIANSIYNEDINIIKC
jgi:hypothetical protein